jgi:Transcriptional regulator PadR-like family
LARVKQGRVESMILTQEEERLLKHLNAADKSGRAISALNCSGVGLARLVAAGYISDTASEGLDRVLYRITDAGKKELINLSFR